MNLDSVVRRLAPLAVVLAASGFAAGCGSTVEVGASGTGGGSGAGEGGSTSTGTGPELCDGQEFVGDCVGGPAVCEGGVWTCPGNTTTATTSTSTGEVETCPEMRPPPGTACTTLGLTCEVPSDVDCGPSTIEIVCVDGTWVDLTTRCLPLMCRDFGTPDDCQASGCRWQEPGCGETPLREAGCFDIADCAPNSCLSGDEICMVVSVEPACAQQDPACNSCGEDAQLCVPQLVGEDDDGG